MYWVVTWHWGTKFGPEFVSRLLGGVRRNLTVPYTPIVEVPDPSEPLLQRPGCLVRLRMFDPEWQAGRGMRRGDQIICLDLDTVITGPLDPLFQTGASFRIMQGGNASNPCPYNGAMMQIAVGEHHDVWTEFSLEALQEVPYHEFPDDQGWLAHRLPGAAGWRCGPGSGVYVFQKPGWPGGEDLPEGARLVTFNGKRSPAKLLHKSWVRRHWH